VDRRILRRHHRAQRARIGREQELVAERSLARRPKPVLNDHVGGAALERDFSCVGRSKLSRLDVKIRGLVEPARLDHPDFPGRRSGLLDRDAQAVGGFGAGRQTGARSDSEGDDEHAFNHRHSLVSAHHPPRRISMPRAGS
jgi:hypothetical protein